MAPLGQGALDYNVQAGISQAASWLAVATLAVAVTLPAPGRNWQPGPGLLGLTLVAAAGALIRAGEATGYGCFERSEAEKALLQADLQAPPTEPEVKSDPDSDLKKRLGL